MRSVRSCNVAVIGGAGFLGSHLTDHLVEDRACEVTVVDNLCVGRREFVHPRARFVHADITESEEFLKRTFAERKVRFVFNYAAHPYIPLSFARPHHVFKTNANGAIQVINAAQEAGCEAILQVSSAEIYGDAGETLRLKLEKMGMSPERQNETSGCAIDENAQVVPHSTYGVAKAAVDAYVQTAWRERGTPCIALRQFNCVGERETHPYVIPEIIGQLAKQTETLGAPGPSYPAYHMSPSGKGKLGAVKLGNNSFRDFIYAGDAVKIAVELLERGEFGQVYNLGSETGVKMYDLAKLIGKVMGFADVRVEEDAARKRPWEIWKLLSCNDKVYNLLKGSPDVWKLVPLEDALRRTAEWFRKNGSKWPWEDVK